MGSSCLSKAARQDGTRRDRRSRAEVDSAHLADWLPDWSSMWTDVHHRSESIPAFLCRGLWTCPALSAPPYPPCHPPPPEQLPQKLVGSISLSQGPFLSLLIPSGPTTSLLAPRCLQHARGVLWRQVCLTNGGSAIHAASRHAAVTVWRIGQLLWLTSALAQACCICCTCTSHLVPPCPSGTPTEFLSAIVLLRLSGCAAQVFLGSAVGSNPRA